MIDNNKPMIRIDHIQHQLNDVKSLPELYAENGIIRALVQMIPTIGPILDAFAAMPGTKIKERRLIEFIVILYESIKAIEDRICNLEITKTEEFHDIFVAALDAALKSRSKEKLVFNIMIITNLISVENNENYRPEEYIRTLAELTPIETKILAIFYDSYINDSSEPEDEDNELKKAQRIKAQERVMQELSIETKDELYFLLLRLERTGFIREITGMYWDYDGGRFTITEVLNQLMEYLSKHPFSKINFEDLF